MDRTKNVEKVVIDPTPNSSKGFVFITLSSVRIELNKEVHS